MSNTLTLPAAYLLARAYCAESERRLPTPPILAPAADVEALRALLAEFAPVTVEEHLYETGGSGEPYGALLVGAAYTELAQLALTAAGFEAWSWDTLETGGQELARFDWWPRQPLPSPAEALEDLNALREWVASWPAGWPVGRCGVAEECLLARYVYAHTGVEVFVTDTRYYLPGEDPNAPEQGTPLSPALYRLRMLTDDAGAAGTDLARETALECIARVEREAQNA